jgi:hypothetical protein
MLSCNKMAFFRSFPRRLDLIAGYWTIPNYEWYLKPPQYRPLWFVCFPVPFFQQLEYCSQSLTLTAFLISPHGIQKFFSFWSDLSTRKCYCAIINYHRIESAFDEKFPQV